MSEFYPFAPRESQLEEYREDARRSFSRIGWACFAMMLVMQGGAALLMLGCQLLAMRGSRFMIAFIQSEWFQWVITDAANYGLGLPVLLVVQPKGASVTLAAQIQGLVSFRKNSHVSGILLNDCSEKLYKMLKALLERETGLPVLGYLPHLPQAAVESRHLGLKTADEIADLQEKIALLADALVLDWQRLAVLTEKPAPEALPGAAAPTSVRIAVAKDEAFCFTYAETLDALRDAGAELVLFSPVQDAVLPENIGGLYLPGGYPELYAKTLSENKTMLASIRQAVQAGLPAKVHRGPLPAR